MVDGTRDSQVARDSASGLARAGSSPASTHEVDVGAGPADLLSAADPLTRLRGVGEKVASRLLDSLGVRNIAELLLCFPRRLREIRELEEPTDDALDLWVRLPLRVTGSRLAWLPGRRSLVTIAAESPAGAVVEVRFFNQPYLKKTYEVGLEYLAEGILEYARGKFCLKQPRLFPRATERSGALLLSYPEVSGMSEARFAGLIGQTLSRVDLADWAHEELPPALADGLPSFALALREMHAPASLESYRLARHRFALLEAMELFRRVDQVRRARLAQRGPQILVDGRLERRILAELPFELTGDQSAALQKIWRLMQGHAPMGLLLQGDVATGKTAVAWCSAMA
ncbi:MAG: hypothetical protein VX951_08715, partial [Planctomycetota bacterium]|nr:hypothetical protein [Planctomycetota bacterium]